MKNLNSLNHSRGSLHGQRGDEHNGVFNIKIDGKAYTIVASNGGEWEHVSVSNKKHVPSWRIMCRVKDMFFESDEVVMQLHPAKRNYVNIHENCLHLWRPLAAGIPVPPAIFV
ncbi:hypothetical protein LCGC14_0609070 [marine sediment metagenome]|uniref:DUF7694 domain-containing protein n=1 Tax=marine sediment metagenome TaxID=412755 RepID=A0A0F9RD60_9ZZZZ